MQPLTPRPQCGQMVAGRPGSGGRRRGYEAAATAGQPTGKGVIQPAGALLSVRFLARPGSGDGPFSCRARIKRDDRTQYRGADLVPSNAIRQGYYPGLPRRRTGTPAVRALPQLGRVASPPPVEAMDRSRALGRKLSAGTMYCPPACVVAETPAAREADERLPQDWSGGAVQEVPAALDGVWRCG